MFLALREQLWTARFQFQKHRHQKHCAQPVAGIDVAIFPARCRKRYESRWRSPLSFVLDVFSGGCRLVQVRTQEANH